MVLTKEQYMKVVKNIIGEGTDADSIKLLEDLTDTYNSFETPQGGEWETKFKELELQHKDLSNRYKERFFAPATDPEPIERPLEPPAEPVNPDAGVTFDELLKGEING